VRGIEPGPEEANTTTSPLRTRVPGQRLRYALIALPTVLLLCYLRCALRCVQAAPQPPVGVRAAVEGRGVRGRGGGRGAGRVQQGVPAVPQRGTGGGGVGTGRVPGRRVVRAGAPAAGAALPRHCQLARERAADGARHHAHPQHPVVRVHHGEDGGKGAGAAARRHQAQLGSWCMVCIAKKKSPTSRKKCPNMWLGNVLATANPWSVVH